MSEIRSEVPPNETSGRGTPVMGSEAVTAPTLIKACKASQIVIPEATSNPYLSGAL